MGPASRFGEALLQLLAPWRCAGCDDPLQGCRQFCPACAPLLDRPAGTFRPPGTAAAAFVYGGPLADAIVRLKYAGRSDLAAGLGQLLAAEALPYAGLVDRVVPLPLHAGRLRERGFNQAALLAAPVARALGVPLDTRSLRRARATRDQAGLRRNERSVNVRSAFVARPGRALGRVLLIDDVRTTGATLAAASEALVLGGALEVRTLALACAED